MSASSQDVESESLLPPVRRSAEPQPHSMTSESESSDYGVILLEAVEVVKADCEGKLYSLIVTEQVFSRTVR